MKNKLVNIMRKFGACAASAALLLAVSSLTSTCLFMSYQPDVPEELLK